jgi:soluble lytic murein transglycosylase-like protein
VIEILIISIALEVGVPPYLALAIAYTENPTLDPLAIHINQDGTLDRGVMQLNSGWFQGNWQDPETNIRVGCELIKELMRKPSMNYWQVCIAYNCGYRRFRENPPHTSIEYANRVFTKWNVYRHYKY